MLQKSNSSPMVESSFLQQANGRLSNQRAQMLELRDFRDAEFLSDSSCECSKGVSIDFSTSRCLALASRLDWCTPGSAGSHPAHFTYRIITARTCIIMTQNKNNVSHNSITIWQPAHMHMHRLSGSNRISNNSDSPENIDVTRILKPDFNTRCKIMIPLPPGRRLRKCETWVRCFQRTVWKRRRRRMRAPKTQQPPPSAYTSA
jgi:hypothetical protein